MPDPRNNRKDVYFKPPAKVLVVDDSHLNRSFLINVFTEPNYLTFCAENGEEGIELARKEKPELIMMDIMMPEMDGFETTEKIKNIPELANIPVIFITALDAIKDKLRAFEIGGVDFVTKPFNHKELTARARTHIELSRAVRQREQMLKIAMEEKRDSTIARIAAGISHNFNNMLTVLTGNIMFIESQAKGKLEKEAMASLCDIKTSLERMQALSKQFLLLAQVNPESAETLSRSSINLKTLIEDVIGNLSTVKEHASPPLEVKCKTEEVDGKVDIFCNYAHIREMIHMILNEAVEITLGQAETIFSLKKEDHKAKLKIRICNLPFSELDRESIFEPFALPISSVGTGLSFSVAQNLIELNNGSIDADLGEEGEITLSISLPVFEKN